MKTTSSKRLIRLLTTSALVAFGSVIFSPIANAQLMNYALVKPATASGSYPGVYGQYSIDKGNDGATNTIWNGGAHSAWWQVDLGGIFSIDQVNVFSLDGPGYHIKFQLSSSTDGTDWSTIGGPTVGSGDAWSFSFATGGTGMRYINYTTIGESGSDWATLAELQALGGNPGPGQAPEPASLALVGLALAGLAATRRKKQQTKR